MKDININNVHQTRVAKDCWRKRLQETTAKEIQTSQETKKTKDSGAVSSSALTADIIITGEGISEFAGRVAGLVSCKARLEVQAVKRNGKEVVAAERTTRTVVDLSEVIAAKTALQAAGHELAIKLAGNIAKQIEKNNTVVPK